MTLNEGSLEKRFNAVSNSTESIQSLSYFCLHYKAHYKKIVQIWLRCLQKAKNVMHRLTLIYLANDIVQNARRREALQITAEFKEKLKESVPYLRDSKIKSSVERVFSIWQDRSIYDAAFLTELKSMLNSNSKKNVDNSHNVERSTTPHINSLPANAPKISSKPVNNHQQQQLNSPQTKSSQNQGLVECLNRLASIEKDIDTLNQKGKVGERLTAGEFSNSDENDKALSDVKNYMIKLKDEIDERTKLSGLLDETLIKQKKWLKESEDELVQYKSKLEYVTKLKDELRLGR